MSDKGDDRPIDRLEDRIERGRRRTDELAGDTNEPRFSDDGRIDDGAGSDASAPPG